MKAIYESSQLHEQARPPAAEHPIATSHSGVARRVPLIVHVIYRFGVGGLENGLVNLINLMPAEDYRHAIVCLTEATDFRARLQREVPIFELHKRPGHDLGLYHRLLRVFRNLRPDIVHTRNLAAIEAQVPALLAGVPVRVHGEHGRDVADVDGTSLKYRVLRMLLSPMVDRFVPLSRDLTAYLRERVHVPARKIVTICNGVDLDRFRPREFQSSDGMRACLPSGFVSPHTVVIGSVGRMEAVKDPLTLVRSFIELVAARSELRDVARLVMVGDGSLRQRVLAMLREANCDDIAWLPGSRDDVADLLRAMDLFVLPSLAEGISNTILEAMASGLPVVATDVGGNGELVIRGETGSLVPRRDTRAMSAAIARYLDDRSILAEQGSAARRVAEQRYGIDDMVGNYQTLYEELLAMKRGPARD